MKRLLNHGLLAALATISLAFGAAAQEAGQRENWDDDPGRTVQGEFFLHGSLATPVGAFKDYVDLGGGGGAGFLLYLDEGHNAALRLEGSFVVYGTESFTTPLSTTVQRVNVQVRTTNYIASAGAGPQLMLGSGPVRPYAFGTVGISYFATESSVSGTQFASDDFAATTNLDDLKFSMRAGGGLMLQLSRGNHPVSLDFSASYQHNGTTEYLTKGDVRDGPGGRPIFSPVVSDTNLMTYRVGLSIGTG